MKNIYENVIAIEENKNTKDLYFWTIEQCLKMFNTKDKNEAVQKLREQLNKNKKLIKVYWFDDTIKEK